MNIRKYFKKQRLLNKLRKELKIYEDEFCDDYDFGFPHLDEEREDFLRHTIDFIETAIRRIRNLK